MRLVPWQIALLTGVFAPVLGFFVAASAPATAVALIAVGAGAAVALLLIPEMSLLLWLGVSVIMGVGIVLLHTLLHASIPLLAQQPYLRCLASAALLLGALATFTLWRARWRRVLCGFTRGDTLLLLGIVGVFVSSALVSSVNGYVQAPDGTEVFQARGFINGDAMTLFALVNASGSRQEAVGSRDGAAPLLRANPFAGNGPLEYPTLLHRALADVLRFTGGDITRAAWWLMLPVLFGTVAVSVLSVRFIFRDQRVPLWSALVLLAAFGTTWESFTYPQSHTFLTGLFFLFMLLLVRRDQSPARGERIALRYAIGLIAVVLLFSNAVLGTAAVAIAVTANLLQAMNRRWPLRDRISGLIGATILLVLFFLFPPGEGSLGTLNVAYTAIPQFLTAAVLGLVVLWGLWAYAWLHGSASLLGAAIALPTLAVVTLFLSGRDIVAENAPRFLFLLTLLGWPVLIPLAQRVADWWRRQVWHVEHTPAELAVLWVGGVLTLMIVLMPTAASVFGTLDVLVRKPPLAVSADELAAFAWIRENTGPTDVFARAPESIFDDTTVAPLSLPAFTGRAQLRSEYWLSPNDRVLEDIRRFFAGNDRVPEGATHLFCGPERSSCPGSGRRVSEHGAVEIRALLPSAGSGEE